MRVLILGAAPPPAENTEGHTPTWLAELHGQVLLERFVSACADLHARKLIFAVSAHDVRKHRIDSVIALVAPDAAIVNVVRETQGAACTALLAIPHIDAEDELLILNSNEFLDIDYREAVETLRQRKLDAGVVVFPSIHPRYSYVRLNDRGHIIEAAEKHPISRHATAGFYWFRRAGDFVEGAQNMIRKDAHVDGKFFICPVFNELVLQQRLMGVIEIEAKHYHPLKSRRQIALYEADRSAEEAT